MHVDVGNTIRYRNYDNRELPEHIAYAAGRGHTKYPCLHRDYSPSSRYPCVDFSPLIYRWVQGNNQERITDLVCDIVVANPGLGIPDELIRPLWGKNVQRVVDTQFEEWITAQPEVLASIRTIMIQFLPGVPNGGFVLTEDETITYAALALCTYDIQFSRMRELVKRGNDFIDGLVEEGIDFWSDFPRFQISDEVNVPRASFSSDFLRRFQSLTFGTRKHLWDVYSREIGNHRSAPLPDCSYSFTRKLGLDKRESADVLVTREYVEPLTNMTKLCDSILQPELFAMCQGAALNTRKSWNKRKLFEVLVSNTPEALSEYVHEHKLVQLTKDTLDNLNAFTSYLDAIRLPLQLILGFATDDPMNYPNPSSA